MKSTLLMIVLFTVGQLLFSGSRTDKQLLPLTESTYAVVVGISNYIDPEFVDLKFARRDAEAFAAFLQSPSGGSIPKENVRLLTDAYATNGRLNAEIDWLLEKSLIAERVIVYFAGYGDTGVKKDEEPQYIFPADAPVKPLRAGIFKTSQIGEVLDLIADSKKTDFLFIANLYKTNFSKEVNYEELMASEILSEEIIADKTEDHREVIPSEGSLISTMSSPVISKKRRPVFLKNSFIFNSIQNKKVNNNSKITNNHLLLDGLLGFADRNEDEDITFRELKRFFKKSQITAERQSGLLFTASHRRGSILTKVDPETFQKLKIGSEELFPSVIQLETGAKEERILKDLSVETQLMYRDFLITLKLGNLLFPEGQNADFYYRALIKKTELKKLHSNMRRKLAVAMQDEVQQAINSYLQLDNRELERRTKDLDLDPYLKFREYMGRSIELYGSRNFMINIMKAKYHYFSGLVFRMKSVKYQQPELLDNAAEAQKKALEYESGSSFIHNELGVIYSLKKEWETAGYHFKEAIEYSPGWGIPYSNLCLMLTNTEQYEEAVTNGIKAFQKNPKNIHISGTLASAYLNSGDLYSAERMYRIILRIDPKNSNAFYDLACIKALSGKTDKALLFLEKALINGFKNYKHITMDPDLESIKKETKFMELKEKYFIEK